MATVEDALQTQIRNIETTYGRPMRECFSLIEESGLTKHTDVVALLKKADPRPIHDALMHVVNGLD